MKISWSWLKEWVDVKGTPEQAAEKLADLGFPVDKIQSSEIDIDNVVAARIIQVDKHPNADRLQLATVDDGSSQRTVVCGAPNIAPGQMVPLALPGAELPGGFKITPASIRGVESHGMLCSSKELGLSADHSGIFQLSKTTKPGVSLKKALGGGDTLLEVDITPNRPDALSHVGIARELAALSGKKLKTRKFSGKSKKAGPPCKIKIQNSKACPRYIGRLIHGVKIGPSPDWMAERLKLCGIRPINNIVDITNYVLLEWGHPLHAFDLSLLEGGEINVRNAKEGEKITALDGKTYTLEKEDVLIADQKKPVAIAGIMGGEHSGVTDGTADILLESAVFDRVSIRKTSQRLELKSESSIRFEKGTDPVTAEKASLRAAELILKLAGGSPGNATDCYPKKLKPVTVSISPEAVSSLAGATFTALQIKTLLNKLDIKTASKGNVLICEIPPHRKDLQEEADLAEDVIRLVGYNSIPSNPPVVRTGQVPSDMTPLDTKPVENFLKSAGLSQAISSSFSSVETAENFNFNRGNLIEIENPLSMEETVMRPMIAPLLIKAVKRNANYQRSSVRLFEIGRRFAENENNALALVLYGLSTEKRWNQAGKVVDFFELKGLIQSMNSHLKLGFELLDEGTAEFLHPNQQFVIRKGNEKIGWAGLLHPRLMTEMDIKHPLAIAELTLDAVNQSETVYSSISDFPFVERDIALLVDAKINWSQVQDVVRRNGGPLLKSVDLFDVFSGGSIPAGKKSLAFRVRLQSSDKTLSESDISGVVEKIKQSLQASVGADLR